MVLNLIKNVRYNIRQFVRSITKPKTRDEAEEKTELLSKIYALSAIMLSIIFTYRIGKHDELNVKVSYPPPKEENTKIKMDNRDQIKSQE